MIFISILILIVAIALPSINKLISPILYTRISSIVFIYAGALSFNALYIQSIGSGIGIYSGLFQVTTVSQLIDTFIFIIGSLILIAWPSPPAGVGASSPPELGGGGELRSGVTPEPEEKVATAPERTTPAPENAVEYSLIVLFSTLGASLLVSSADLISMYLSIELQSFGVYILTTLYRDSESATSAGLKYFLLGGLSSCLILLGAGIIYTFTGLTNFESIYSLVSVSPYGGAFSGAGAESTPPFSGIGGGENIAQGLSLGLIIIIVGFLFKIAAAPLHNWAPDVYDDSPTIVTIWLTIMPKISIIIFILELYTQIGFIGNNVSVLSVIDFSSPYGGGVSSTGFSPVAYSPWPAGGGAPEETNPTILLRSSPLLKNLLLLSSLISLIIGTVVGLAQSRIKRLLAYSTISHIGFMLLALAINTEQSIDSLIFYILQYSITNLNTFLILIALGSLLSLSGAGRTEIFSLDSGAAGGAPLRSSPESGGENSPLRVTGSLRTPERGDSPQGFDSSLPGGGDIKYISELKGQFFSNPLLSLSLTICLFSMAGIPPLLGFFSKQFVLYSAVQSGYYFMSIIGIIVSIISASYYIKIIRVLHTEPLRSGETPELNPSPLRRGGGASSAPPIAGRGEGGDTLRGRILSLPGRSPENFHSYLISTLTLSILFFILKPSILLNSTQLLSLSLFNY